MTTGTIVRFCNPTHKIHPYLQHDIASVFSPVRRALHPHALSMSNKRITYQIIRSTDQLCKFKN